jgi:two-component system, NarL family, nitrate/nitrite response regulator NarL
MSVRAEDQTEPRPIRVLLVDDHTLFRNGLKSLLQRHKEFEVVGEAGDGLEGVKRTRQLKPDVVLLDLHMPGITGREAVRLISEEAPETQVLMLTVSEDAEDLIATLQAGARGYLLKNIETDFLLDAIRRAASGEAVITPQMTGKLVEGFRSRQPGASIVQPAEKDKLSPREREILALLAKGESNKEIARELDVAESTVKIHVQSILKKLNLSSRVQAAVYAVEHGLAVKE